MSKRLEPPCYDPYDAVIDADPYPVWARLRAEQPLYDNEQHDFYALRRFADVHAASLDWPAYSSARGTVIEFIDTNTPVGEPLEPDPSMNISDRFDAERVFDRHVTFGYGLHFCLGANLARLEAAVVIEETLARFPEWSVDEADVGLVRTSTVRGPAHVPIRL